MTSAGINAQVNVTTTGTPTVKALSDAVNVLDATLKRLIPTMTGTDGSVSKVATGLSKQLNLYRQAASLASTWAQASIRAAEAEKQQGDAAKVLAAALAGAGSAIQSVTGISQRSFDAKQRFIQLTQQQSSVLLTNASAAKTNAEAQLIAAKALTESATAQRLANGQGAPLSAYQAATLSLQRKAQAAQLAAQAAARAEQADIRAATASTRLATADQRQAALARAAAESAAAQAAAQDRLTGSVNGSYFALYQVAAGYALVSKAASSVVSGTIGTAAQFQQSFNQVIRTTDQLGDSSVGAQGKLALLYDQLVQLSTTTPVAFTDVANIAALGGQLGIAAGDIADFTETVAEFSAVTGVSASDSASAFGRLANLLGIAEDQFDQIASTVAELGVKSAATEPEILAVGQSIAATTRQAGFSTSATLGLSSAFASLKIPAELGRGVLTRLFNQISQAASEGADGMADYAKQLGISNQAALTLQQTSPSTFFTDLIRSLSDASANGQDLNVILSNLGITNSRDVPVIERLAGSYNLLQNNIMLANKELAKKPGNNYLSAAASQIFSGLNNQAKELGNTFTAVLANIGGPALAPLEAVAGALKVVLQGFEKLPAYISAPILAVGGLVAAFAAFKAILAIGIAGTLAFKQALGGSSIQNAGANISTLTAALRQLRVGTDQATVGQEKQVAATNAVAAASERATLATEVYGKAFITAGEDNQFLTAAQLRQATATAAQRSGAEVNTVAMYNLAEAYRVTGSAADGASLQTAYLEAAEALENVEANASAGFHNAQVAALLKLAAADIGATEATAALTVAQRELSLATATSSKAASFFGGPWFIGALVAVTAISALAGAFKSSGDAAEKAAAAAAKAKNDFLDAAGGAATFDTALQDDTKAGATAAGAFEVMHRSIQDLHNGTAQVTDALYQLDSAGNRIDSTAQTITTGTYQYADSVLTATSASKNLTQQQSDLAKAAGLTNDQLSKQDVILGKETATAAFNAIKKVVTGDETGAGGILSPADVALAKTQLSKQSTTLGGVLADAFTKGASTIGPKIQPILDGLNAQLTVAQSKLFALVAVVPGTQSQVGTAEEITAQQDLVRGLQAQVAAFASLTGAAGGANTAITDILNLSTVAGDGLKVLYGDLPDAVDPAETAIADVGTAADSAATQMSNLAGSFTDVINQAFDLQDAVSGTQSALDALGQGLITNGLDFSNYTEAGRQNLSNLKDAVTSYATQQAASIKAGTESAEQGATNVSTFVQNITNELATKGVDTSQIDFLVNYVHSVVANPAVWDINTDTSAGIANISNLATYAGQVAAFIAGINSKGDGTLRGATVPTDSGSGASSSFGPQPNAPDFNGTTQGAIQRGAAAAQAAKDQADAEADLANKLDQAKDADAAATDAANAAADASNDAGKAAKQAGTEQKDAAENAAEALQKQQEYIAAVGSYYAKLGSDALSAATNQGAVTKALQDLGTSLATNGNTFSTYSDAGRANLDALSKSLDAYGSELSDKLGKGTITVDQAGTAFRNFAGGVRTDLIAAGVSAKDVDAYFQSIGATGTFSGATADVADLGGVLTTSEAAAKKLGDTATKSIDGIALSADEASKYLSAVDDYFKNITDDAFSFVKAEGDVFSSIQDLGAGIVANGKSFNDLTDSGRKNFASLSSVFDAFGANLKLRIDSGVITAKQGSAELSTFAGGIYNQLIQLGVKASDITPFFKALGFNPAGFAAGDSAVKQYAGVLTDAAAAARAAASSTSALGVAMQEAATYGDALSTAFNAQYDALYGLSDAQDAATSSAQGLKDTLTGNLDTVKQLTAANATLRAGIAQDTSDITTYNRQIAIAQKYGQTTKVADLTAKRDASQADLSDKTTTLADNGKQIDQINKYGKSLTGNSKEAIANRAAYEGLQKQLADQVVAYAKTGASTAQVAAYTEKLKQQFTDAGVQAGYSKGEIKKYTDNFETYVDQVKNVPHTVTTTVQVNGLSAAQGGIGSIVGDGTFTTHAAVDTTALAATKTTLAGVPKASDYTVRPTVTDSARKATTDVLNRIPKKSDYTVTVKEATGAGSSASVIAHIPKSGTYSIHTNTDAVALAATKTAVGKALSSINSVWSGTLAAFGLKVGAGGVTTPSMTSQQFVANKFIQKAVWMGGPIDGFAAGGDAGGQVPGRPPANPQQDNVFATSAGRPISLRSTEWIMPQPAVEYYGKGTMSAIQHRQIPRMSIGTGVASFAGGGSTGGSTTGYTSSGAPVEVRLSMDDRRMLSAALNRPVIASIDGQRLSDVQTAKGASARRAGVN